MAAAMLHLRKHLFPLRGLSLQRALLSTVAASASPGHFAAEDYLVTNCGLTRERAAEAAKLISHWKSPSNADAVLAFLTGPELGLSKADVALLVDKDPRILSSSVDNTLRARLDGFRSHGFSAAQIRSFVRRAPGLFRAFNINEKLGFWMPFLGSPDKFLLVVRRNFFLVTSDLDKVKTNIQLLQESGLSLQDIAKMCVANPRLLTNNPESTRSILVRAELLGVPRDSSWFKEAVSTAAGLGQETMASKLEIMAKTLGCSADEVARMVQMNPVVLRCSMEKFQRVSEFLTKVAGIDVDYILGRPTVLMYSLERRLVPRHYVMKVLKEKELIRKDHSFYYMISVTEEMFYSKYIRPHKNVLPGLADAYASARQGKIPA